MALPQIPTQAIVETSEVKDDLSQLLHRVQDGNEYLVFEEAGHSVAALIGMRDFEEFRRWRAAKIHEQLGRKLGAQFDAESMNEEQLLQEMEEIRKEVYREQYGSENT